MNYYPELPQVPYAHTTVPMISVISYLKLLNCSQDVKRMAYIMFRNESGNGDHGINNNYCGIQADSGRWPAKFDPLFEGVVTKYENTQPGIPAKERIFLAFKSWEGCIDMLVNRVQGRGLYVGAPGISSEKDLAQAYYRQWVTGNPRAVMPQQEAENFASMYGQALALFRVAVANQAPATHITADTSADDLNAAELEKHT